MTMVNKRREIPEKQSQPSAEQRVLPIQLKLGDRFVGRDRRAEVSRRAGRS
jgi:hypothetical protein